MSEDEAKTNWCCGPPAIVNQTIHHAAGDTSKEPLKCIGSACMAWRWGFDARADYVPARTPEEYISRKPHENIGVVRSTVNGYCGLAGRP